MSRGGEARHVPGAAIGQPRDSPPPGRQTMPPPPSPLAIPPRAYRDCAGEFATGVAVVIAEGPGGAQGMTLNAFASVSLEPLLVMVALGKSSRTLAALRASQRFSISVLGRSQREVAIELATPGAPFALRHTRRTADGFLVIDGAIATQQCIVHALHAGW
jgi:3-hydroxy-9,10-secoandrosta-1,3,5(10)-triene-9,17-dione monooxygenase reductase component